MKKRKFYAVRQGRVNNTVVFTWDECQELVNGYPSAIFRSFPTYDEASAYAAGDYNPPPKNGSKRSSAKRRTFVNYRTMTGKDFDPVSWAEFCKTGEVPF